MTLLEEPLAIESYPHPCESRTVLPNFRHYENNFPIIAINHRECLYERSGIVVSHSEFADSLPDLSRSIIVTFGAETFLLQLHKQYHSDPRWTWKVTVAGEPLIRKKVSYFGFRRANHKSKSVYHLVLDFNSFLRTDQRMEYDARDLQELLELGKEVREFCTEMNVQIRPTAAGLANQLLRHPRFYPEPRRKVPQFINETVRKFLPGNFYQVYALGQTIEAATYIDQQAAHHHAALTTPLPNSNSITAKGYRKGELKVYARYSENPDSLYRRLLKQHGLVCLLGTVPYVHPRERRFLPKYMHKAGNNLLWLWTNEIAYAESVGLRIRCIYATWGSEEVDTGIQSYARWAIENQSRYKWIKSVLLMPYGMLAKRQESVEVHTNGGSDSLILANSVVASTKITRNVVSQTANVLQRGLIESHVRTLSLDMARQCSEGQAEVVSIYADGIFLKVPKNGQLPLVTPWREKAEVTALEFESATRFKSNEMTRFPGTPALARNYLQIENA